MMSRVQSLEYSGKHRQSTFPVSNHVMPDECQMDGWGSLGCLPFEDDDSP